MGKTAWVAGASGLVGGHLVDLLNRDPNYDRVVALMRTPVATGWSDHPKVEQWTIDYSALETVDKSAPVDDLFCALGTTRKVTPDAAEYYAIDVNYPLRFADLGLRHGAQFYGVVSAHGANARSLSGYLKMKGEMEEQLQTRAYRHIAIARPGMLAGDRENFRIGELVGRCFTNRLPGNYKTIQALDVAAALISEANSGRAGIHCLASREMQGASAR